MPFNEADTIAKLVNPALYGAGWSEDSIRREVQIAEAANQLQVRTRQIGRIDIGLYACVSPKSRERLIALVEVKAEIHKPDRGLAQVKDYGRALQIPFVYSTNGHYFVEYCFIDGTRSKFQDMSRFPTPSRLVERYQRILNEVATVVTNHTKIKVAAPIVIPKSPSVSPPRTATSHWKPEPTNTGVPVNQHVGEPQKQKAVEPEQTAPTKVQSPDQPDFVPTTPIPFSKQIEAKSTRPGYWNQSVPYEPERQTKTALSLRRILALFLLIAVFMVAWNIATQAIESNTIGDVWAALQSQISGDQEPVLPLAPPSTYLISSPESPEQSGNTATGDVIDSPTITMYVSSSGQRINARACASTQCAVLAALHPGDSVQIRGMIAGESWRGTTAWYEVAIEEGELAYVHSSLLSANPP